MHAQPDTAAQHAVRRLLDQLVAEGEHRLQVAAYLDGRLIIDAWAAPAGMAVDGQTLFPIFSTGKGIAATVVHRLVERGVLAYDQPIARWWPEFAANGKGGITLRHALTHTSGVPQMPERGAIADSADWDGMCRALAAAEPLHPPGVRRLYHAITYAWTIGETARRADGRDFPRLVQEEVCRPLGIDSIFIGLPASEDHRVVDVVAATPYVPASAPPKDEAERIGRLSVPGWVQPLEAWINSTDIRRACVCGSNGIMSARGIARHYAALVDGTFDGVRFLKPETIDHATVWDIPSGPGGRDAGRYGLGYSLSGPDADPGAVIGHGGYGGSVGWADRRKRLAVGIAKSRMGGSEAHPRIAEAIRRAIG